MAKTYDKMADLNNLLDSVKTKKQAVPVRTGIANLIDTDFTNTADLHMAATNFTNIVQDFANEVAVFKIWNHSIATHDPVTKKTNFFKQLNDGKLAVKKNEEGGADSKIKKKLTIPIDVKLKPRWKIKFDSAGEPIERIKPQTVGNKRIRQYQIYMSGTGGFKGGEKTDWVDVEKEFTLDQAKLESKYGFTKMGEQSIEFVLHWIEKFRTVHPKVKFDVLEALKNDPKHYFQTLGDSIGSMARMDRESGWNLSSLDMPLNDADYSISGVTPLPHSPVIDEKIDQEHFGLIVKMSKQTGALFRQNMKALIETGRLAKSTVAHGENLVPDKEHWKRMTGKGKKSFTNDLESKISDTMGDIYKVLNWIRTTDNFNKQKIVNPDKIEYAIEKTMVKVDMFKHKHIPVIKDKRVTNDNILGASSDL